MRKAGAAAPIVLERTKRNPETEVEMLGWWLGSILFIIIWVAIAFWPARVAARKGHSFFLYFLFSLVFFPAALLVAYMVSDRSAAATAY
jgi:hypothetical protein